MEAAQVQHVQEITAAVNDLQPEVQQAVLDKLIPPPTAPAINALWMTLVRGLLFALIVALGGVLYLLIDGKAANVALTVFTSVLSGLLGLFTPSPTSAAGQGR